MAAIKKTLNKIKDEVKPLLIEMFPDCQEAIEYQHKEGFQEWFGIIFNLSQWNLRMGQLDVTNLEMSNSDIIRATRDIKSYEGLKDYGIISTVQIKNKFHLTDGYHRVILAQRAGIYTLNGCVWKKIPNTHKNCQIIKDLIIKNL